MTDPLGLIGAAGGAGGVSGVDPLQAAKTPQATDGVKGADFKDLLMENLKKVNDLQQEAETAIEDLAVGRRDDVAAVMIAKQKADVAFKMLLQVRNKMMDAYDEIKQMRV